MGFAVRKARMLAARVAAGAARAMARNLAHFSVLTQRVFCYSNTPVFDLTGRVVVISGGNAGIGLGFARGIARAGGDVVIWGRRGRRTPRPRRSCAEFGGRVLAQEVDVSDEARVVAAMAEAVEAMGRVDGVIANAGS